jgi:hypothetical protein
MIEAHQMLYLSWKDEIPKIEKELAEISDLQEQVEYLKDLEANYLLINTTYSDIQATSGFIVSKHKTPIKIGLDNWITNKIAVINRKLSKQKPKRDGTKISYDWQNKPDTELKELFELMTNKYKLIALKTAYDDFEAVFLACPIDKDFKPIKWHDDNASELLFFIQSLKESGLVSGNPKRIDYKKMTSCFIQIDGRPFKANWKQLKFNIEFNLSKRKRDAIEDLFYNL